MVLCICDSGMRREGARPMYLLTKKDADQGVWDVPDAASSCRTSCKDPSASDGVKIRYSFLPQEQPPSSGDS